MVVRDGAVIAWILPEKFTHTTGLRIFGAHTDSPCFKVKPQGTYTESGFTMVDVEPYGGAIYHTWFDRDLALAGRLVDSQLRTHLVTSPALARIPSLAIHLDRGVNDKLQIDAQRDLMAVVGLSGETPIEHYACQLAHVDPADLAGYDLYFVNAHAPEVIGMGEDLLASPRMDNLLSVHAGLRALVASEVSDDVQIYAAFNHEELGSRTSSGADGSFLGDILARIAHFAGYDLDAQKAWFARGVCLSADVVHAQHPSRQANYDPKVFPLIDAGSVLKCSAQMRYATDAASSAVFVQACKAAGEPWQRFVNHNSIPGGSTIGPFISARLGIRTVDVGIPILSMHSAEEMCAVDQPERFARVVHAFLFGS